MDPDGVHTIGVLGVGTVGAGIVQLAAQTGHEVVAYSGPAGEEGRTSQPWWRRIFGG